jgi:hypothetical protein
MTEQKVICRNEIEKNILNVQFGKPLTLPLRILNLNCKFRKIWNKYTEKDIKKAYNQRPEVKAHYKAYIKVYNQRPEVKAHYKAYKKAYYQRPEVKAHYKAYYKAYYQRRKLQEGKK